MKLHWNAAPVGPPQLQIAGPLAVLPQPLANLPFKFVKLDHDPDGRFPHGVPNPMLEENRAPTAELVRRSGADVGIAWDGDYDRCFFFDESGQFIVILAEEITDAARQKFGGSGYVQFLIQQERAGVEIKVDIGPEFVANFRSDGLIIGSPTGSTAYALSAGGPILHPGIGGWAMVPVASHTLSNRPIVLPDDQEVLLELVQGKEASANFDMHGLASMLLGDTVRMQRSAHKARFLHPRGWSYYATLRQKLHWHEGTA